MHEMGIALEIVDITIASIPPDIVSPKVSRIFVSIGKLSAIVADSLKLCFDIAIEETVLKGAELVIQEIPLRVRCDHCHREWIAETPMFICDDCRSTDITILSGRELDIDSIEVMEREDMNAHPLS